VAEFYSQDLILEMLSPPSLSPPSVVKMLNPTTLLCIYTNRVSFWLPLRGQLCKEWAETDYRQRPVLTRTSEGTAVGVSL
jgi:hypothetical protein